MSRYNDYDHDCPHCDSILIKNTKGKEECTHCFYGKLEESKK